MSDDDEWSEFDDWSVCQTLPYVGGNTADIPAMVMG